MNLEQLMVSYAEGKRKERGPISYRLSRFIPVRFTSTYEIVPTHYDRRMKMRSTWWQWRDRIWSHVCQTV